MFRQWLRILGKLAIYLFIDHNYILHSQRTQQCRNEDCPCTIDCIYYHLVIPGANSCHVHQGMGTQYIYMLLQIAGIVRYGTKLGYFCKVWCSILSIVQYPCTISSRDKLTTFVQKL